jgi:hypothetical protein
VAQQVGLPLILPPAPPQAEQVQINLKLNLDQNLNLNLKLNLDQNLNLNLNLK